MTTLRTPVLTDEEITALTIRAIDDGWTFRQVVLATEQSVLERAGADAVRDAGPIRRYYQGTGSMQSVDSGDWVTYDDHVAAIRALKVTPAAAAECEAPPLGWRCTRAAGHDGPCAAVEAPEDVEFVERGMDRLRKAGYFDDKAPAAAEEACEHSDHVRPVDRVCIECGEVVQAPAAAVEDHVGESDFEQWFASYQPQGKGAKQQARDAYAAGMAGQLSGNAGEVDANDHLRPMFEAWFRSENVGLDPDSLRRYGYGYIWVGTDSNWDVWCAAIDAAIDAAIAASKGAKP